MHYLLELITGSLAARLDRFKEKCDAGEMGRKDVVRSLDG